jgi:hypothetical protein
MSRNSGQCPRLPDKVTRGVMSRNLEQCPRPAIQKNTLTIYVLSELMAVDWNLEKSPVGKFTIFHSKPSSRMSQLCF